MLADELLQPLVRRIQDQPSTFSDAALYNIAAWAHHCLISIHPFLVSLSVRCIFAVAHTFSRTAMAG